MRIFLLAAMLFCLSWTTGAFGQAVEFRVAYEDKDSADHTGDTVGIPDNPGIMVEMVGLIQSRLPALRIVFMRKPWARCLAELETGAVDAIFSSSFSAERMKIGIYPMKDGKDDRRYRIDTKSYNLYKLADSPLGWDGARFSAPQPALVAVRGYAIVDSLRKMGAVVSEVNHPDAAFRMLLAGRADGFAQLSEFGDYLLKKNPEWTRIVKVAPPLATKDYYLQISHQFNARHPALAPRIWQALAEVRQAEAERLTAKYLKLYAD